MTLKVGSKCWLKGPASRASLNAWNLYRSKGLPLRCPCHYFGKDLEIVQILSSELVLLKYERSNALTVAVKADLTTLQPETI